MSREMSPRPWRLKNGEPVDVNGEYLYADEFCNEEVLKRINEYEELKAELENQNIEMITQQGAILNMHEEIKQLKEALKKCDPHSIPCDDLQYWNDKCCFCDSKRNERHNEECEYIKLIAD